MMNEQFRIVFEAITQLIDEDQKPKKKLSANAACPMELRSIHSIRVTRATCRGVARRAQTEAGGE